MSVTGGMRWICTLCCLSLLTACANVSRPTGGPKDIAPPQLDTAGSSALLPVNFRKQDITLTFDEYFTLQDAYKNILISPPLKTLPEFKVKGKSLVIRFDDAEVLADSTTYQIQFGDAIRDLNENNVLKNFSYTFSTGPYVDSLEARVKVADALSGQALENMLVALYHQDQDTLPLRQKPVYAAKSNASGEARLSHLRPGTYYLYAWKDDNSDYLHQPETESFGFGRSPIVIAGIQENVPTIRVNLKEKQLLPPEVDSSQPARIVLQFNRELYDLRWSLSTDTPAVKIWVDKDKMFMLHPSSTSMNRQLYLRANDYLDTIAFHSHPGKEINEKQKILPADRNAAAIPDPNWTLRLAIPSKDMDPERLQLLMGAEQQKTPATYSLDSSGFILRVNAAWKADSNYRLDILPGALTDWYGRPNDTLFAVIKIPPADLFGNLSIRIDSLPEDQQVFVQLKLKDQVIREFVWEQGRKDAVLLKNMTPETYEAWVIFDDLPNGRWDPGNFKEKRQAEYIYRKTLEPLRANWDLEVILLPQKPGN